MFIFFNVTRSAEQERLPTVKTGKISNTLRRKHSCKYFITVQKDVAKIQKASGLNIVHSSDTTIWSIYLHFREMLVEFITGF
jgi:hypothetical protein